MSSLPVLLENDLNLRDRNLSLIERRRDSSFKTEIHIGGVEVVEKISAEWTALCEEGASNEPFFRPEWFVAFIKNFETEIVLLTVRRAGKLRAVLPLMREKENLHGVPARKLKAVFNLNTQRFDLIHGAADETERREITQALWKEIKSQPKWDVLEMRLVKKDSWLNDLLRIAESENHRTGIWQMDGAPFVQFPQDGDQEKLVEKFRKSLRKHLRNELCRRLRRLKELGAVEFVITRGYSAELIQKYFELEEKGWKGRGGTAVTCDPQVVKLHDDFARAVATAKDALFIYELKLDGETIAMMLNIMYDRQMFHWKTSYDEEYARYSPGNILFREFLCDSIRKGATEADLLSPATTNKRFWATGEREHVAFYVFRRGFYGWMLWKWKFSIISRLREFKSKRSEKSVQ